MCLVTLEGHPPRLGQVLGPSKTLPAYFRRYIMSPFLLSPSSPDPVPQEVPGRSTQPLKENATVTVTPPQAFLIPESLSRFRISPADYIRESRPKIDQLVAGTIVSHHDKILLVQRSRHDYGGLCWEIPGGSCDEDDWSILGAAARELWEEAGLCTTAMLDLVDDKHSWPDNGLVWKKLTFLVEVGRADSKEVPEVKLDPNEHEDFVWATEEDVVANRYGNTEFTWMSEVQRQTILKAFRMLKQLASESADLIATVGV